MVSQPSKRLTFETDRPPQQEEGASSSTQTARPTFAPPPSASSLPPSHHRPPHLQPFLNSQQPPQTPPRPILVSSTSPTAPAPIFQSTPTRSRTRNLPDEFLTSSSLPRPSFRNPFDGSPAGEGEPDFNNQSSPTPAPQFAEQLSTPRRRPTRSHPVPPSNELDQDGGFYDASEGDLYRGPGPSDPRPTPNRRFRYDTSGRELDEDAITLRSVSSGRSSGSSSTDASVMSRSRRRVVGALEAVGRGLGVLGSDYSRSSSSSESDEEEAAGAGSTGGDRMARKKSFSKKHVARRKRRGRAWSFGRSSTSGSSSSSESDDEPLGRRRAAGRREFVLLLPPPPTTQAQDPPPPPSASSGILPIPTSPPSRLIRTPYLPDVLKAIKELRNIPPPTQTRSKPHRLATSLLPPQPTSRPTTPVPLTPRQLLNSSMLPALPSQSHDPTQRRPPQLPFSPAMNARLQIPRPSPNAPFPSSPQPSPPTSGTTTPTSYFPSGGGVPKLFVEGPTPAGTPRLGLDGDASPPKESTKAWWLDVHCPGWEDMRAIGELFALHPLTLEDILHQDPREKLETFDRLGYYLISFRAIDESYFRYTDEPTATSSGTSPSILSPDGPPADPTLGPTNPDLPGNPSKEPVLITSSGGGGGDANGGMRGGGRKGRRRGKVEIQEDRPGKEGLEGVGVGAVNVYLVVFRDGIISFHFDDISKHTQGVRDRLLSLEEGRTLSSDWIAHGLMDSIVDSFFPLIDYVEFEADDIDSQIVSHDELVDDGAFSGDTSSTHSRRSLDQFSSDPKPHSSSHSSEEIAARLKLERDSDSFDADKKQPPTAGSFEMSTFRGGGRSATSTPHPTLRSRTKFRLHFPSLPPAFLVFFYTTLAHILLFLHLHPSQIHARAQRRRLKDPHTRFRTRHSFDRAKMLKRMTDTRRLITGLSRLLIPKSEVVGRLRKRAEEVSGRRSGWQHGGVGGEMVTYIGDIQDHILSMQSTLLHYEQILSQAQPAYVSQLRVSLAVTRGITDKAILSLSVVSIGILPMQFISGLFSMNVNRPQNGDEDHRIGLPLNVFGIIVCVVALVAAGVVAVVRYWKRKAWVARKGLEGRAMS